MRRAGELKAIQLPSGAFRYDLQEILRLEEPVLGSRQMPAVVIKRGRANAAARKEKREPKEELASA